MTRRRVAIIGAGFSGVALAAQLMRRGRGGPDVVLIERGCRFGPGLAYSTENPAHLLNVRASNMSARADAPEDFAKWVARRGVGAGDFAPRKLYGEYVAALAKRTHGGLFGPSLKRVRGDVVACRREGGGWVLQLASGKSIAADAVVLAVGHRAPSAPASLDAAGVAILDPWDAKRLPARGDVLLVGTGLTMIDVALSLAARRKGLIYALSRRGLTPRAHLDPPRVSTRGSIELPTELSDAVFAFRREVERMAEQGEPWQCAVDRLRAETPALWRRLSVAQQRRFLRHLRPWWDVHRHRAAPDVAKRVAALQAEGRLRVLAGEIMSVEPHDGHGILLHHRQRGSLARHRLEVAAVVNCTGGNLDYARVDDPLIVQMREEGLVRPNANGLGLDVDEAGRVLDVQGTAQADLFTIGAPTQGAFWESTAVPELRVRAAEIAALL